jgi:hypothetical protein
VLRLNPVALGMFSRELAYSVFPRSRPEAIVPRHREESSGPRKSPCFTDAPKCRRHNPPARNRGVTASSSSRQAVYVQRRPVPVGDGDIVRHNLLLAGCLRREP